MMEIGLYSLLLLLQNIWNGFSTYTTHIAQNLARQTHQDKPDCEEERRERGMVEEGEEVAPPHGQ